MGQENSQNCGGEQYTLLQEVSNGSLVSDSKGQVYFVKEYSYTSQQAYQQAFVNYSKKLSQNHEHVLALKRTNTKVENTFCSTFYKISLIYEYFDHTLAQEIRQRNLDNKVFDEKEVWSVLCSCVLGVSRIMQNDHHCHSALTSQDIRLNPDGMVKVLATEMVGMKPGHDANQEGSTRQLAVTIINLFRMEEISNYSMDFLMEAWQSLSCSMQMKGILRLMLSNEIGFIELQEQIMKLVHEETDSLNSYSNTPNIKDYSNVRDNSYSRIPEQSKQDDILHPSPKDLEDQPHQMFTQPITLEEEIVDEKDSGEDSQENTLRQSNSESHRMVDNSRASQSNTPQLSCNQSPSSRIKKEEHSLFTDPKLLSLIHNDLYEIKKRKSVSNSRKVGVSDSKEQKEMTAQINTLNFSRNSNKINGMAQKEKDEFGGVKLDRSQAKENNHKSATILRQQLQVEKNIRTESQKLIKVEGMGNPQGAQKKYDNIMEMEDMGFKKKKQAIVENRVILGSVSNLNSKGNSTSFYNESQSNVSGHKESRVSNSDQLQFVTETYIRGRYEGTKLNGMRHGKGVFYYNEGGKYNGEWKENKMFGKGVLYYPSNQIAYEGQWKNDQLWGKGILYNQEVVQLNRPFDYQDWEAADDYWIKYQGEFSSDSKNGHGRLFLSNGQIFQGDFKEDMVHGEGILMRRDGRRVKGLWRENKLAKVFS